jgi:hypothetical protein
VEVDVYKNWTLPDVARHSKQVEKLPVSG